MASVHLDHSLADKMVTEAIRSFAEAKFHGDVQLTLQEIHQGNCEVCGSVSRCLARQMAGYLAQMDHTIKAVFRYEPDYDTPRHTFEHQSVQLRKSSINLVAWGGRKSAAFNSLSSTLTNAISDRRKRILCRKASVVCQELDIQMVEDKDVLENRGQALLINSPLIRTEQIWKQPEDPSESGKLDSPPQELLSRQSTTEPVSASIDSLFGEALIIEKLPPPEKKNFEPRLQEIKVELIRRLLSEQPRYIEIARECLTIADLVEVSHHRIGTGQIGGESAGLVLAARILNSDLQEPARSKVKIPESYYLGADLFYGFMSNNQLMNWNYQKYKPDEQIRSEYPLIREAFRSGEFSPEILNELRIVLKKFGNRPLIVRSSSILEDSFGSAFAGKYEFLICPNQNTPEENLKELVRSIASIYASTFCPEALMYRYIRGLRDYDERMGVLIQPVQGERFERYLLPTAAGVALSKNLYRWTPQIRSEDGFVRLVWGLGTSAVERASNNPPRLVALSNPTLQPSDPAHPEWSFCQQFVDVIDLQENRFKTLPVHQVISPQYAPIRLIAQHKESDYFTPIRGRVLQIDIPQLAITFDEFLRKTDFAPTLIQILRTLEKHYHAPVDIGFTTQVLDPEEYQPEIQVSLLHCRRQGYLTGDKPTPIPPDLPPDRVLFKTRFMVPRGQISGIQHVLLITPEGYDHLPDQAARDELRLAIYRLNTLLGEKKFICVGPGQWGANNPKLGVYINYADIHNAAALVELYGHRSGSQPDPALGTYSFQDLMEAHIYPLTVTLDQKDSHLNHAFFYETQNQIEKFFIPSPILADCLRLIEVESYAPGCKLEISMDDEKALAVAYLLPREPDQS